MLQLRCSRAAASSRLLLYDYDKVSCRDPCHHRKHLCQVFSQTQSSMVLTLHAQYCHSACYREHM